MRLIFLALLLASDPLRAQPLALSVGGGPAAAFDPPDKEATDISVRLYRQYDERLALICEYEYSRLHERDYHGSSTMRSGNTPVESHSYYDETWYQPHQFMLGGQMALDHGFVVWGGISLGMWRNNYKVDVIPGEPRRFVHQGIFLDASSGIGQRFSLGRQMQWGIDWFMYGTELWSQVQVRRIGHIDPQEDGLVAMPRQEVGSLRDKTHLKALRLVFVKML